MKVCLVQYDIAWQNPTHNKEKIGKLVEDNPLTPDLYILPEMFTTGFTMESEANAESMQGASIQWMKQFSRDHRCAVTGSLVISESESFFNRLVWIDNGAIAGHYDKRHLFAKAGEDASFRAGQSREQFVTNGLQFCPMICYDLRFPVWSRNTTDYDVLIYVANWPAVRRDAWRKLLMARAIENQCYVIGLNRIGVDANGLEYCGDSQVIDPYGSVVADLGNKECIANVTIDRDTLLDCRQKLPFLRDRDQFEITV